jgi:hypothetical protein
MFAAVGWSAQSNALAAGYAAATMALRRLANRPPRGAIVLGSSWFDQRALLDGVRSGLGSGVPLAGGSTDGEIIAEGPQTHSCVVLALGDEDVALGVGVGPEVTRDPRLAGFRASQEAARQINGHGRRGVLFFGDGRSTAYAGVVRGMQEVLGTGATIVGALMGDSQYARGDVLSDAVVALACGGSVTFGVGMQHGFAPISKPWRITRAEDHIVHELDGRPAASVYEDYFGAELLERARGSGGNPASGGVSRQLSGYPLGMQERADGPFLLRNITAFGQDGSLACTGDVTEGAVAHLMISSRAQALEAASLAAQEAVKSMTTVTAVLVCDSVARKRLLGHEASETIGRIRQVVGASVPIIGCYTHGEQASLLQTGAVLVLAVGQ